MTKDILLAEMDSAGVSRVVIVPPSWEGDRNDLALEAARLHLKRFAVMGRLALERPESQALVADWKQQQGMLGMCGVASPCRRREESIERILAIICHRSGTTAPACPVPDHRPEVSGFR